MSILFCGKAQLIVAGMFIAFALCLRPYGYENAIIGAIAVIAFLDGNKNTINK